MNTLVSAALWVVGKALAPVADGLLEAWGATNNLGPNIEALRMELLLVKATLELTSGKQIHGQAMEELLGKLRDSAHCAEDLLDELDYFRIRDELHGTSDAADHHAKGCVHDLALNARHAAKAVGKRVSCCAWSRARQRSGGNSSRAPNANQEVSGCMPKLGKILLAQLPLMFIMVRNFGQSTLSGASQREPAEEKPMPEFNRVDVSERMRHIIEQMQPVRKVVAQLLQSCDRMDVPDIAQSRPTTTSQSIEPKLYGRDHIMDTIIHDMTKGKYHSNGLTMLPIVGPGGIGKTTLIQHIYHNKEVQKHFQAVIWVCVSLSFNLNKLLEDIKKHIPPVEGEKGDIPEELIAQRLKSKRFLLVLDDIWNISVVDDWKRLLLPLKKSQEKGSVILLTTRFPAIVEKVKATTHIKLEGLKSEEFRKLFLAFVFGDGPLRSDHNFLLQTGHKIMEKLKGSPLAAKTVGTLLSKDLNLHHWKRVLESREWERQTDANDIMPALKLSYDYLTFHQQRCFFYSALFPEDHKYSATELINLWRGLHILQSGGQNQTLEYNRLLNDLVTLGFFKIEKNYDRLHYVMHDLLHDLALQVASHDCISLHRSNMGSVEIQPSIRHLSIIIDDYDDILSHDDFKSQLRKLKTKLKVTQLHTLMLFGRMDESFASILGDLFREVNDLRVLHLVNMPSSVESILHNFASLVHLRYLCLGTKGASQMHLPLPISRFYHLRILDLRLWYGHCGLPKDLSNLAKLCHLHTPQDELHSDIINVGKLICLEELKVFRVNKESEGFEPKQLEHMEELREIGIYNLENIHTEEEATKAKLIEKNYLERLTLHWDRERPSNELGVEEVVLESLQPHGYLRELCIRGHKGPSCPTWLGDKLTVEALKSLHLVGVSWQCLPSFGKFWDLDRLILEHIASVKEFVIEQSFCKLIRLELVCLGSFEKWVPSQEAHHMFPLLQTLVINDCPKLLELPFSNHIVYPKTDTNLNTGWFPKLEVLQINKCPELLLAVHIPWTETLRNVWIHDVKLLEKFNYNPKISHGVELEIVGKDDLQSLDQVVAFHKLAWLERLELKKCPPLEWKHLVMLTSLKKLEVVSLDGLVGPSGCQADVEWQHPAVKTLKVVPKSLGGPAGKELTELLTHLPRLSKLDIFRCKNITQLVVGVDLQQTASATKSTVEHEKEQDSSSLLLFPTQLSDSLRKLIFHSCPELVLVDPPSTFLPARGSRGGFQALRSLQSLKIWNCPKILSVKSSLEPLSNLTSLTLLYLWNCGENLRCKGLGPLLTNGGQLRVLSIHGSPRFFAGWQVMQDEGGEEQELQQLVSPLSSSKLHELSTDEAVGLPVSPIYSFLSSSLTKLDFYDNYTMEHFTKEQEDSLQLLVSLQQLEFTNLFNLQHLPATLHKLTNLKRLKVSCCPAVRSLPKDGLPKSLQELDVMFCSNKELEQQCKGLLGTIPKIILPPDWSM